MDGRLLRGGNVHASPAQGFRGVCHAPHLPPPSTWIARFAVGRGRLETSGFWSVGIARGNFNILAKRGRFCEAEFLLLSKAFFDEIERKYVKTIGDILLLQSGYCFNEIYDLSLTGGRFSEWNGQTIPVRACVMHPLREVAPPGNGIEGVCCEPLVFLQPIAYAM